MKRNKITMDSKYNDDDACSTHDNSHKPRVTGMETICSKECMFCERRGNETLSGAQPYDCDYEGIIHNAFNLRDKSDAGNCNETRLDLIGVEDIRLLGENVSVNCDNPHEGFEGGIRFIGSTEKRDTPSSLYHQLIDRQFRSGMMEVENYLQRHYSPENVDYEDENDPINDTDNLRLLTNEEHSLPEVQRNDSLEVDLFDSSSDSDFTPDGDYGLTASTNQAILEDTASIEDDNDDVVVIGQQNQRTTQLNHQQMVRLIRIIPHPPEIFPTETPFQEIVTFLRHNRYSLREFEENDDLFYPDAGLSRQEISSLKCYQFRDITNTDFDDCSICIKEFVDSCMVFELGCGHIFHRRCLKPWIKMDRRCPLCRFKVL